MQKKSAQTENKNEHPNKIGIKEGIGYMLGDSGNLFVLTYVSSFLKVFYSDVLKISLSKISSLFLFTRLWDAINDPVWGYLVAKKRPSKDGKFRPYLKWVSVPLGLSAILCFVDFGRFTQSEALILVFAYITYILFGMLYTGMNIPFGSLASVITDDPDGRTLLSTFRSIGGGIGGAVPLMVAPLIIYKKVKQTAPDGSVSEFKIADGNGMFFFALAMGILAVIFYLACFKTTKERIPSEEDPKVDMKKTYLGMLKAVRSCLWLLPEFSSAVSFSLLHSTSIFTKTILKTPTFQSSAQLRTIFRWLSSFSSCRSLLKNSAKKSFAVWVHFSPLLLQF